MDNQKRSKANQDIERLDNSLREVRGVSLGVNQKLEEGMMGGVQATPFNKELGATGLIASNAAHSGAVVGSSDGYAQQSIHGDGALKLPTIGRNQTNYLGDVRENPISKSHVGGNAGADAVAHHHLNITLGEEQFQYSANKDQIQVQKLPNITGSGSNSSVLRTQLANDYVGLMSKTQKDRSVNMDFRVQNSFAIGGNMGVQQQQQEQQQNENQNIQQEQQSISQSRGSEKHRKQAKSVSSRNANRLSTIQPEIQNYPRIPQIGGEYAVTFESYIGKVINSVQHRKKNPRLKSLFNQGIQPNQLEINDYQSGITPTNVTQTIIPEEQEPINQVVSLAGELNQSQIKQHQRVHSHSVVPRNINQQVSLLGNKDVIQTAPKATEQVAYLLRQIQKKERKNDLPDNQSYCQIFLPLELVQDKNSSLVYKENKNPPENSAGTVIFSKNGFVTVANDGKGISQFISNDQYIDDGVTNQILKELPFFKKFQSLRFFLQWKSKMRKNAYERKRELLAKNYIFSKPIFSKRFTELAPAMNKISQLQLIEVQPDVVYGIKQQCTFEDRCKVVLAENKQALEEQLTYVKTQMKQLKSEITQDDERFEDEVKKGIVKEMVNDKHQQLVMFSKQRVKKNAIDKQYQLKQLRHVQFDQLLFMVFRYWSTKITELLKTSKQKFNSVFSSKNSPPQFEVSICFGEDGMLDSEPTMNEHQTTFQKVFENMESSIFKNQFLLFFVHDLNDLFFGKSSLFTRTIFENMQKVLRMNQDYKLCHNSIFERLRKDVQHCEKAIVERKNLQEIRDFCVNWQQDTRDQGGNRQTSAEMSYFKETWAKMDEFTLMIADVPSSAPRVGTILIETNTLKKQLTEMPKQVLESIKHNVTQTMDQETKTLREELSKTQEILEQAPSSLNTYVEQVNTLKYVEHKKVDFQTQYEAILSLSQQCKSASIKVSWNLQMAIDEVKNLYTALPSLCETAQGQLTEQKDTMEKIMKSSSNVLSKKIKAFEKKYIETYLKDGKGRLDDCGDTLEELFKRSKAIHEIRSKVILYREFLKLLYENEENPERKMADNKLSCAGDFEILQDIHKHTIRLWKIMLYWKKRRQMCYNTPFLQLDTQLIIKSIHKVIKYFDEKLPQHEVVQKYSQNLCKIINSQVQETSLIIEFVKDLRKDSLQIRHWMQVFDLIKAPHLKIQTKFTIVDLRTHNIQQYEEDIHHIIEHANTEAKYESIFKCICEEWEALELKIIPFKDSENSYILVNTLTLNQAIEENLNTLEVISQSEFAVHIKQDIFAWLQKLKTMHQNLEIWIDAQRYWINLDIIFNSALFEDIFGGTTKNFIKCREQYQRIMWSSYKNPKAIYNLMIESRIKVFKEMTVHFQVLQKKVHEFLEAKRLIFSRFFFLNDSQFLDLLTLVNTSQDFSIYVNSLFVGAQNLYIQPADKVKLKRGLEGELGHTVESDSEDSIMSDDELLRDKALLAPPAQQSIENSKMGIEGVNQYQVLGMISQNKELFLFEKPVIINNDDKSIKEVQGFEVSGTGTGSIEQWFLKVEMSMNETMNKQVQYAVKSFATRSLDEWILDYPQQVVITTLNLILSNEINDILEARQKEKDQADAESNDGDNLNDGEGEEDGEEEGEKQDEGGENKSQGTTQRENEKKDDDAPAGLMINKKTLKGTASVKRSPGEEKSHLLGELFGFDFNFDQDPRFDKAIEIAKEDLRLKKIAQATQTASTAAGAAAAAKAAKRKQKRPEYKDYVMEVLGQNSFYGIYLRVQYWINKIIKQLNDESRNDWQDKTVDFSLTGVQKMVLRNVIMYLLHQRDSIDKMITLDIHDKNDFEWQSKVKILWSTEEQDDSDPGYPIVQCGGWQQQLGSEYLGAQQRVPLSLLTDRYYVFISSALREKSGVLFRCNQSHQHASDIFEEFAHQCHMPFKSYQCNQDMNVPQLMQVINGAAMAKFWVFFEHLDSLPLVHFQIVVKEIQMVQQKYIISELGENQINLSSGIHINENKGDAKDYLEIKHKNTMKVVDNLINKNNQYLPIVGTASVYNRIPPPCLGIFGSLGSSIQLRDPEVAENLNLQAQGAFRTISLAKPNTLAVIRMLFKSEGFAHYNKLARITDLFISAFTQKKNEQLYGDQADSEEVEKTTEKLVVRDVKLAVRLSILLRDQEWKGFREGLFRRQQKQWKFELQLYEKTLVEKEAELANQETTRQKALLAKEEIEIDTMREGFRNIIRAKFFNEWRAVKSQKADEAPIVLIKNSCASPYRFDERKAEEELESLILETYNETRDKVKKEEAAEKAAAAEAKGKGEKDELDQEEEDLAAELKKKMAGKRRTRRLTTSNTAMLNFAGKRATDEAAFHTRIEAAFEKVIESRKLQVNTRQMDQCMNVIEHLRRHKAVAIVGPVCSGKTQILKIVSQSLQLAYDIIFRTSAVNPQTFTKEEFYGPINAFDCTDQKDQDAALKKRSIFQIILDNYQHEKLALKPEERNRFVQSFLIDSDQIDQYFMDSLIQFIQKSNIREREYFNDQEFLLHLSALGQAHDTLIQHLPINLPNGNVVMLPSDLYFFFETENLSNASPLFLSQIGLVVTQDSDVPWTNLHKKEKAIYFLKHHKLSEQKPHLLQLQTHFTDCEAAFLYPMIRDLEAIPKIRDWQLWNVKSLILQFYKMLNALTYKLKEACDTNLGNEDPMLYPIGETQAASVWSTILTAFVMSFGVSLSAELQKVFITTFEPYKKLFMIELNNNSSTPVTLFDIYFDVERLQWEIIQEKLEYKLKLGYYPKMTALLVPTPTISLSYYILEQLTSSLKFDGTLNKNFRVLGPQASSKSVILTTFAQRSQDQFDTVTVPMSSYLSFERLRTVVERLYVAKRKKIFAPKNEGKKVLIMIDDLHLQSNLKLNIVEFMRTWTQSNGYFDVGAGFFKRIADFSVVMAQNSSYRVTKCKHENRQPLSNRFLFYTNTQYTDEMTIDKFKPFIQHWLTSKSWTPNKLLQKYYIVATKGLMTLLEKIKRNDQFHNSSFTPLYSFDILSKFCSSLVLNTVISDNAKEIGVKGQKEEHAVANLVLYEVLRNYADRIYKPKDRLDFITKAVDIFRLEFQMKEMDKEYIDSMIIGNFHEKHIANAPQFSKFVNVTDKKERVKDIIFQRLDEKTNNHYLKTYLDTPTGIRDVFRISRILCREQQHGIICGSPSSCKHECLQIATIINDVVLLELNAPKYNEPSKFAAAFKEALLAVVRLESVNCYIVISDEQLRDPVYIDFVYNYIAYIGKNEECILMDHEFKEEITNIEVGHFMNNKDNFKYNKDKQANRASCLQIGVKKLMMRAHIVFMIDDMQTYHEWFSLFPGLETKCDVMFMDDLTPTGFHSLTRTFLDRTKIDDEMQEEEKDTLAKCIVNAKDQVKKKILSNFYTNADLRNLSTNDEYQYLNGQGVETVYPNSRKQHFGMLEDGKFKVYDPLLKQINYNLRAELGAVMKGKFIMYLEVFRYLYDFLSLNLSIRKNYYETFINKTRQFSSFFDEIHTKKADLHLAANNINYKMTMIQDKINRINKAVKDKQETIVKRKAEIEDLELQLKNQQAEVDQVLEDKNRALGEVLKDFSKLGERDLGLIVSAQESSKAEQALLDVLAMIIDQKYDTYEFDADEHGTYFLDSEGCLGLLRDRCDYNYDDPCFRRLKEFITQSEPIDYSKCAVYKCLYAYLSELFRKQNVRNTMSHQQAQIAEIKASIDSSNFSINYSEYFIREKREELQQLDDKIQRVQQRDGHLSKKIEVAEISHMRTQHIFDSVKEYGQKVSLKLDRINTRLQALVGDCIILAASVCLLGFFSSDERIDIRQDIVKFVSGTEGITCSKDWTAEKGKAQNPKIQTKIFKQILKEYGLRHLLLPDNYSGILTESVICETLFHMVFAPSCPLIIDPTGEVQQFIRNQIISDLNVRQIHGSDLNINSQLQSIFRSSGTFGLLSDVNTFAKATFGQTQDQTLMHRLCTTFYSGVETNYERALLLKKAPNFSEAILSSADCVNRKMPVNGPNLQNVSLYQVQVFSPSFDFQNSDLFMARGSCLVAMSTNDEIQNNTIGVNAWMELKELLLEQINQPEWTQLQEVKAQIKTYNENKSQLNKAYENAFLVANHDTLQRINEYTKLKQTIEDIEGQAEERLLYKRLYDEMIQKYEILTYYSKVILNMYLSLKVLSKLVNEVTLSWKMFKKILTQVLKQIIANLAHQAVTSNKKKVSKPQVDVDLKFFQTQLIPAVHRTLVTTVRQDSSAPLFNLIFAMRISVLQEQATAAESQYFFEQLLLLKDFHSWRKTEIDFVNMQDTIPKPRLLKIKEGVSKLYPDVGKKFVESLKSELGGEYCYKDASLLIYQMFGGETFGRLSLIQEICLGFLCPDHEFKSKLTQFVYQQLSDVFEFSEENSRLHQFLRRAAWKTPIALQAVSHVNMINSVSSIAQHYGVGLDVIRQDPDADQMQNEKHAHSMGVHLHRDENIKDNLRDYASSSLETHDQKYQKLWTMSTTYVPMGNVGLHSAPQAKLNFLQGQARQKFENPDVKHQSSMCQLPVLPIDMVKRAAKTGSWVLVSTVRFPQFWKSVCTALEAMDAAGQIKDSFRLIFDLQGYAQSDIPDSFIFDHAIPFHLTEQNAEEFESFEDIWATILDERVLIKLEEKVQGIQEQIAEANKPKPPKKEGEEESKSEYVSSEGSAKRRNKKNAVEPESPSNIKLIKNTIKSEAQQLLYKQFMGESKHRMDGLKFNLLKAAEPSEHSKEESEDQNQELIGDSLHSGQASGNIPHPETQPSSLQAFANVISKDGIHSSETERTHLGEHSKVILKKSESEAIETKVEFSSGSRGAENSEKVQTGVISNNEDSIMKENEKQDTNTKENEKEDSDTKENEKENQMEEEHAD